jgi:hypothetical protein
MGSVFPGRFTAQSDEPFVVFLIGMRVNRLLALRSWTRVAAEFFFYWRGVGVIQYWRSFDLLHAYAHARDAAHLPAWAEFNRRIGGNGSVGIWHETYTVAPGQYEAIYANMPRFGLARATEHVSATGRLESARSRIGKPDLPEAAPHQN